MEVIEAKIRKCTDKQIENRRDDGRREEQFISSEFKSPTNETTGTLDTFEEDRWYIV